MQPTSWIFQSFVPKVDLSNLQVETLVAHVVHEVLSKKS